MSNETINDSSSHCKLDILWHSPVYPLLFIYFIYFSFIKIKLVGIFQEYSKISSIQSSDCQFTLLKRHHSLICKCLKSAFIILKKNKIVEWIYNLIIFTEKSYFIYSIILNLYSCLKLFLSDKSTFVRFSKSIQLIIFSIEIFIIYNRALYLNNISAIISHQTSQNLSKTAFDGVISSMF